ncbi:hypothetical protein EON63_05305, partial [archaeon]
MHYSIRSSSVTCLFCTINSFPDSDSMCSSLDMRAWPTHATSHVLHACHARGDWSAMSLNNSYHSAMELGSGNFFATIISIYLCGVLASAGGIGGGGVIVPLLLVIGNYEYHTATILSLCAVLGNHTAQSSINLPRTHPHCDKRPLISWDLVMVLLPTLMGGSNLGMCMHHTPYTIHHIPYTIYHTPYTIHHTPYTIYHIPYTIYHTPYTIYHTPYTIYHTPYTIHHIPYTIHHIP